MLILFLAQKWFGDDFGQYDTKTIILHSVLAKRFAIVTPKVPGDQILFKKVCYMLTLKVTKFQLPTSNGFRAVLRKNSLRGGIMSSVQNRVNIDQSKPE